MALPLEIPDRMLRDMPRPRKPDNLMQDIIDGSIDAFHARAGTHKPRAMVLGIARVPLSLRNLRVEMHLLLRGGAARVLPPRED